MVYDLDGHLPRKVERKRLGREKPFIFIFIFLKKTTYTPRVGLSFSLSLPTPYREPTGVTDGHAAIGIDLALIVKES